MPPSTDPYSSTLLCACATRAPNVLPAIAATTTTNLRLIYFSPFRLPGHFLFQYLLTVIPRVASRAPRSTAAHSIYQVYINCELCQETCVVLRAISTS